MLNQLLRGQLIRFPANQYSQRLFLRSRQPAYFTSPRCPSSISFIIIMITTPPDQPSNPTVIPKARRITRGPGSPRDPRICRTDRACGGRGGYERTPGRVRSRICRGNQINRAALYLAYAGAALPDDAGTPVAIVPSPISYMQDRSIALGSCRTLCREPHRSCPALSCISKGPPMMQEHLRQSYRLTSRICSSEPDREPTVSIVPRFISHPQGHIRSLTQGQP